MDIWEEKWLQQLLSTHLSLSTVHTYKTTKYKLFYIVCVNKCLTIQNILP